MPILKELHSVVASLERYDQTREDKEVKKIDEPEKPLVFRSKVNKENVVCTLKQPLNVETNIGNLDQSTSPTQPSPTQLARKPMGRVGPPLSLHGPA